MEFFRRLSLQKRIIGTVAFACLLCAGVSVTGFLYFTAQELNNGIINKERTVHAQLAAATQYVAEQGGLAQVIAKYSAKYQSPSSITETERQEILKQVPIYAALQIGAKNAKLDGYIFRVFSDEPRRKENLATSAEMEIFRKFQNQENLEEQITNDGKVITVYRPVRLSEKQGCLTCHGNPTTSPWKNGHDILGFKMENWTDGKLHGVFAVSQNIAEVQKAASGDQLVSPEGWMIVAIVVSAVLALLIGALVARAMAVNLTKVSQLLSEVSVKVNGSSGDLAEAASGLSEATTQQAASLQETSASIEEVNAMVAKNADNARNSAQTSLSARSRAENGREVVSRMSHAMEQIDRSNSEIMEQINQSNQQMTEIIKVIEDIGTRTKVINDIVFQTKLLSFNASVEAARAGEHGKGFAVVAEEVGKLAQMSGNAAKEITDMLDASIKKVEGIVHTTRTKVDGLMGEGRQKVEMGSSVAKECGEVLGEIARDIESVSRLANEISTASQEQAKGVQEVNKAVTELDQVTQRNSATSQRTALTAENLAELSDQLQGAVSQLLQAVDGGEAPPAAELSNPRSADVPPERTVPRAA